MFAVGAVTGTILSFEMGLLWPGFMAAFGDVFGLGFALEGFSFFVEAIFIAIYVYGWDRLSPRAHFLSGIPIAVAGVTGSLMVISVNAWMQNPAGFRLRADGQVVDVEPVKALFANPYLWPQLTHMYLAAYLVAGFLLAAAYAVCWLRGDRSRYVRTALDHPAHRRRDRRAGADRRRRLDRPPGGSDAADEAGRLRRSGRDDARSADPPRRLVRRRRGEGRDRDPAAVVVAREPTTRTPWSRASTPCRRPNGRP